MNKGVYMLLGLVLVALAVGMIVLSRIDDSADPALKAAGYDDRATDAGAAGDCGSAAGGSRNGGQVGPQRSLSAPAITPRVEADPALSSGFGTKRQTSSSPAGNAADGSSAGAQEPHSISAYQVEPIALNFDRGPFQRRGDGTVLKTDTAEEAGRLNGEDATTEDDIEILGSVVNNYSKIFGANPVAGENRDLVRALTGDNPHQLALIDPSNPAINDGEPIDRWGTPFRFHPVDSQIPMEIFSVAPDAEFGTSDDVMIDEPMVIGPMVEDL